MSATLSKADYLKRYMSDSAGTEMTKKKRKKPKAVKPHSGLKIIDEDLDFKTGIPSADTGHVEEEEEEEEAPTVAEIVDERPVHVQRIEQYRKDSKWKLLASDKQAADRANVEYGELDTSPQGNKQGHDSDSDTSPPRRKTRHDSDESPPRTKKTDVINGKTDKTTVSRRQRHDSDSDQSIPRRQRHDSDSDSDQLLPRRQRHDSDQSPPRKQRHDSGSDQSPPRKQRHDSGSDQSPPRKQRHDSGSDQSPPRKQRNTYDSDQSPPRKSKKQNSDSDQSPPRRQKKPVDSDESPPRKNKQDSLRSKEGKMSKTLAGAKAGLSSAREMREEAEKLKRKENKMFQQIDAEALGKNAETVFRDKGGKRRNLKEEKLKQRAEDAKKEEMNEKYMVWGKGMAQKAQQEQTLQETLHEMDKPLARFKDDEDLDAMLKERERAEDPMLAYMQKKKAKENKGGSKAKAKPRYRGPEPPPNRFNIWPGYRWDGVDRSNGFEKEFFAKMANKKAVADMAYKWSVEDM